MAERALKRVEELAGAMAQRAGCELVLVELVREPAGRILRVLVDKPGGVGLGDCQTISEDLSRALDAEPPVRGPYSLEVSSPGIERPLVKLADFDRFAGSKVAIRLRAPHEGRKRFRGDLIGTDGADVLIDSEGAQVRVPFAQIARTHLVVES